MAKEDCGSGYGSEVLDANGDGEVKEDEFTRSLMKLRKVVDAVYSIAEDKPE